MMENEIINNPKEKKPRKFNPQDLIGEDGRLLKLLYSNDETAFLLAQGEKTICRWIKRELLKTSKSSRHVLVTADSIRRFLITTV